MAIKGLLYIYILLVTSVSLASYKKGIYLIWLTLLFVPTIILEQIILFRLPMTTILLLGSVISEMRFKDRRTLWNDFITENQKAILAYLFVSVIIVLLSQTVPIEVQLRQLLGEISMLLFALQTFMLVKDDINSSSSLFRFLCWAVVFNIVYCVFFEVMVGINPAGMPLYILLGEDDNQFIVDAIESERGAMSFRAQTVYRHPLSLGQYMLVMLPLFLTKGRQWLKFIIGLFICLLIVLSGSRSAMVPMVMVLLVGLFVSQKSLGSLLRKSVLMVIAVMIATSFVPNRMWKKYSAEIEPFVASLQFWDDEMQKDNDIGGSSMEMRINQFDAALEEIEENPVFGRGYGYRDYYIYVHNDLHPELLGFESVLLLYLVERGWLGLIFFFIMALYIYKLFVKEMSEKITFRLVFIGYLLSIIMTGVRPLTLLFVCLTCSIAYGLFLRQEDDYSDDLQLQELSEEE